VRQLLKVIRWNKLTDLIIWVFSFGRRNKQIFVPPSTEFVWKKWWTNSCSQRALISRKQRRHHGDYLDIAQLNSDLYYTVHSLSNHSSSAAGTRRSNRAIKIHTSTSVRESPTAASGKSAQRRQKSNTAPIWLLETSAPRATRTNGEIFQFSD